MIRPSKLPSVGALLLFIALSACGTPVESPDGGVKSSPTVLSSEPASNAVDVPLNTGVNVTFDVPMEKASLTSSTFTLASASGTAVTGTVISGESKATFWPSSRLTENSSYTATVTTGARSATGAAMKTNHSFTFKTGTTLAPGFPVSLGTAANYVILAKSGISSGPASVVTGDIAVSPAAATYITGFSLSPPSGTFATSSQVTGKVYAADFTSPTPANLTTAVSDMETAFTDAAGRPPDFTELHAGDIGGQTLAPGVYKWGTGLLIPTDVTLSGSPTSVWIFQVAQGLTVSNGANVVLAGGALPKNIFWQVAQNVEVGTTAQMQGILLAKTAVALRTGATIKGRLLSQTAVNLEGATVEQPAP